jgi:putative transposase
MDLLVHHVVARGAAGAAIFADATDRDDYLERLGAVADRYGWRCLAYCLMTNHTHVLVEARRSDLRVGVRRLRRAHASAYNVRHGRCEPVWSPATRPIRIRSDPQLWAATAYLAVNPVAAGLCATPEFWRWSSHAATIGATEPPRWLAVARLLELLEGPSGGDPRARYTQYVADRVARVALAAVGVG